MDALDNLYVLVSGHKTFHLVPPHLAPSLRTISPTYAVLNNGFSLQYSFQTDLSEEQRETLLDSSVKEESTLHQLINGESLEYDSNTVKFYHFSAIDDLKVPFLLLLVIPRVCLPLTSLSHVPIPKTIEGIQSQVVEVNLSPGDLFFLPAGWFHQVRSWYYLHLSPSLPPQVTSSGGRHMAVNYWWKPPGWQDTTEAEKRLKYRLLSEIKAGLEAKRASSREEL
jgi:hypothetical protein